MPEVLGYLVRGSVVMLVAFSCMALIFSLWAFCTPIVLTPKHIKGLALIGAVIIYIALATWLATGIVWVVVG